jgi:hypothetical protein
MARPLGLIPAVGARLGSCLGPELPFGAVAGRTAQLKRGRAGVIAEEVITEEVITAVGDWPSFAAETGVPAGRWSQIQASQRVNLLQRQHSSAPAMTRQIRRKIAKNGLISPLVSG